LLVRLHHDAPGDLEVGGEVPAGGQAGAGREPALADGGAQLGRDLPGDPTFFTIYRYMEVGHIGPFSSWMIGLFGWTIVSLTSVT
jgi:hypothetical protein